jgi:hypothetical protein
MLKRANVTVAELENGSLAHPVSVSNSDRTAPDL